MGFARELVRLLGHDVNLWAQWIQRFVDASKVQYIAVLIPTHSPRLSISIYEAVLQYLFCSSPPDLISVMQRWARILPPIFDHAAFLDTLLLTVNTSEEKLRASFEMEALTDTTIYYYLETLSLLFLAQHRAEEALHVLLRIESFYRDQARSLSNTSSQNLHHVDLKDRDSRRIFDLIEEQHLFTAVADKIPALIRISRDLSQAFLVKNVAKLPVERVVSQIRSDKPILLEYLTSLMKRLPNVYNEPKYASIHEMHLDLFADLSQKKGDLKNELILFLKFSSNVSLQRALDVSFSISTQAGVFVLTRLKRYTEALSILLQDGGSAREVLDFVAEHGDNLWKLVMEYSFSNLDFLGDLLDSVGNHRERACELLNEIPSTMKIPQLETKIRKIVQQLQSSADLAECTLLTKKEEMMESLRALDQSRRRAVRLSAEQRCIICGGLLLCRSQEQSQMSELSAPCTSLVILFGAGKFYHRACHLSARLNSI